MSLNDFENQLAGLLHSVGTATRGVFGAIDKMLFQAVINGLKSEDFEAASISIDQLAKEKKTISIAPLYLVYKSHPNQRVRVKAGEALKAFGEDEKIRELTEGKEIKEAMKSLIEEFGNFKS